MRRIRRGIALAACLSVVSLSGGFQVALAAAAANPARSHSDGRVEVSAKTPNGHLRCTVTFSKELQPGHSTDARMAVENLTHRKVHVDGVAFGDLDISKDGVQLLRTTEPGIGIPPAPLDLAPHHSKRITVDNTRVIWGGTLTLQPICDLPVHLRAVHLAVDDPGATPLSSNALAASVGRMYGVFDHCTPSANDSGVNGTFAAPDGSPLTPLDMHCWADVQQKAGFDLVDLFLVTPHDAPRLEPPILQGCCADGPGRHQYMQVGHWQFVVTASQTISTGGVVISRTPVHRGGHSIWFSHGTHGWSRSKDGCGDASWLIEGLRAIPPIQLGWMDGCF